ncbi:MAG: c-type cytochrome [Hyphomicrobiaceae bacterium]
MSIMEVNKVVGAALSALLFVFGGRELIEIVSHRGDGNPGYVLPVKAPVDSKLPAAGPALDFAKIADLLTKANVESGQAAFKKCTTCHTPEKGGKHGAQGPNLWGIVGRDIGSAAGFNYSEAMKAKPGDWTFENLARYLHDPKTWIPNNKMAFAGLKDDGELADVLVYLRSLSDGLLPLPQKQ